MFDSNMITNALSIILLLQNWYLSQSTNDNKSFIKNTSDVIAKINKNSEHNSSKGSKTHHALHWYNNKKLVKVLEKIAGSTFENDFEGLKEALNSTDNQKNADIKLLKLNIGDLSILDAIDNLSVTRAGDSIEEINHSRENLKTMIGLIPKDKKTREEFFKIPRDKNFDLIITPNNNPKHPNAKQFLQKVVKIIS
jgi:benzoyl-CoA reductase/2-hydroxyglutaryl-CoA dehydratase subunit BcrC/BadD/HgdB